MPTIQLVPVLCVMALQVIGEDAEVGVRAAIKDTNWEIFPVPGTKIPLKGLFGEPLSGEPLLVLAVEPNWDGEWALACVRLERPVTESELEALAVDGWLVSRPAISQAKILTGRLDDQL